MIRDVWNNALRNLRNERSLGRVVTIEDVMAYAKPGHKLCRGTGVLPVFVGSTRFSRPCGCAAERFQRARMNEIEPVGNGEAFRWLVGTERPRAYAMGLILGALSFLIAAVGLAVWGVR